MISGACLDAVYVEKERSRNPDKFSSNFPLWEGKGGKCHSRQLVRVCR